MTADPDSLHVLASVPDEMHAALIVNALSEAGIRARATGGFTAGFRAEAPGEVSVVVSRADLARAREILAEIAAGRSGAEPVATDQPEQEEPEGRPAFVQRNRLQFRLGELLVLQTVVSVGLALGTGLGALTLMVLVLLALVLGSVVLVVAGTVRIASDLDRARRVWGLVGRLITIGFVVAGLPVLILHLLKTLGLVR
jgi:hypothetical protein